MDNIRKAKRKSTEVLGKKIRDNIWQNGKSYNRIKVKEQGHNRYKVTINYHLLIKNKNKMQRGLE